MMVKIGHVKEAQGLTGALKVALYAGEARWPKEGLSLQLETKQGERLPFVIRHFRTQKNLLILEFEGLADRTQAEALRGCTVWVDAREFVSQKGQNIYLGEILDFEVFDGESSIGKIVGFSSNGPQDLLVLKTGGGSEHLVPLVKEFILKIDFSNQKLMMQLPHGLLEE